MQQRKKQLLHRQSTGGSAPPSTHSPGRTQRTPRGWGLHKLEQQKEARMSTRRYSASVEVKCSMIGNDKVKWIWCSTKQLSDLLEEALAPILGEGQDYSCKQGIISSWLPNQFPKNQQKR